MNPSTYSTQFCPNDYYLIVFQERILARIHFHLSNGNEDDTCDLKHCITHQKFAMTLIEQVIIFSILTSPNLGFDSCFLLKFSDIYKIYPNNNYSPSGRIVYPWEYVGKRIFVDAVEQCFKLCGEILNFQTKEKCFKFIKFIGQTATNVTKIVCLIILCV